MKKKFSLILVCLMLMVITLSGCNLFQLNTKKYLEQVVAKVNGVEVTKEELLVSVNRNAADYVQSYNLTAEEAIKRCLDNLINQKLLVMEAEKYIEEGKILSTQTEKDEMNNDVWREVFNALNANLKTFEDEIKKDSAPITSPSEETPGDANFVYKPYAPSAKVVWDKGEEKWVIQQIQQKDEEKDNSRVLSKNNINEFVPNSISSLKIQQAAKQKYLKTLLKNEEGKELSTNPEEVWDREVDRIYKNIYESTLIKELLEYHQYDYSIKESDVLRLYSNKARDSFISYKEDNSTYTNSIDKELSNLFYIPPKEETYFFVGHILIQYSAEELKSINDWNKSVRQGDMSEEEYNRRVNALKDGLKATERDKNGAVISRTKSVQTVLNELNKAMKDADENQRADIFNEFMYRYNEDTGILNKDFLYTIGEKTTGMMESFTDVARTLHNDGVKNSYTKSFDSLAYAERWADSDGDGVNDKIDYGGFHIIFYAGEVGNNLIEIADHGNIKLNNQTLWELSQARINELSNKTYFDLIYDELNQGFSYSVFENAYIEQLRSYADITRYPQTWGDLL